MNQVKNYKSLNFERIFIFKFFIEQSTSRWDIFLRFGPG